MVKLVVAVVLSPLLSPNFLCRLFFLPAPKTGSLFELPAPFTPFLVYSSITSNPPLDSPASNDISGPILGIEGDLDPLSLL